MKLCIVTFVKERKGKLHGRYHHGYNACELRRLFVRGEIPPYVDPDALHCLVKRILDLAREGLIERSFGEESMLDPLYDRWERRSNPASDTLRLLRGGHSLEEVIEQYA